MQEKNITYEIKEHVGVISKHDSGWCKELNVISWNGQAPKYDIRDWDSHHEHMSRGITLHPGEMRKLVDLFIAGNNRRVVEEGQAREAERMERRNDFIRSKQKVEDVDEETMEGATPPEDFEEPSEAETESATEVAEEPAEPELTEVPEGEETPF